MKMLGAVCLTLGLAGCVAVPVLPPPRVHLAPPVPAIVIRPAPPRYYAYRPHRWQHHY